MNQPTGLQFSARIGSLPDDTFVVYEFELNEALSATYKLTLSLYSADAAIAVADVLDQEAELIVFEGGEKQRRFHGVVAEFSRGDTGHRRTRYDFVIKPALWRLSLIQNSRIFQQQNSQDILQTLLEERGIADTRFDVIQAAEEREYCVQHRETDFDFFHRLAAEEGWHYRFDHGANQHPIAVSDHHREAPQLEPAAYNGRAGGSSREPCVFRFSYREKVAVAGVALKDYTFKNPAYPLMHEQQAADAQDQRPDYQHFDYPGRFKQDASGKPFTQTRLDSLRNDTSVASGASNRADFTAGAKIPLTDHETDSHNRDWLITAVTHSGKQPQALEEESGGEPTTYNNIFDAIPADRTWRPRPATRPLMDGPQIAIVTGPAGEEIHCDQYGRVKVSFPWDRYSRQDEHSSAWLRVSQGWAGGNYGFMAVPRIGHEVIVSFLDGDPDQPIITGRTYHATNATPYTLPQNKTRTVLKTQTHGGPGHNELSFEDQHKQELVYLRAQKDHTLEINNDQQYTVGNDRTKNIGNDQHLTVERDEFGEIKRDQTFKIGQDQKLDVVRDRFTTIGRHYRMEVTDRREDISRANHDLEVGGHYSEKVQGKVLIEAGESALVHTKNLTLNGSEKVVIQGPAGKITIDSGGVSIDAPSIKLNGPVAVATGSVSQLSTLKSAAEEGTPLVDLCGDCGEGV
ncbi:MAG: type VI secretion system tip protein VgrG [Alteromonadaceae bacterium]|nr:type VI secretion system tip protein VgrG [Alteromonadaceae bacterium]